MPYNGTGIFLRVRRWVNDAAANIKIRADFHDSEDDNFAQGLTMAITRDGQSTILANLPMSGFRHTNVSSAQNLNEYPSVSQVQNDTFNYATDAGAANAYVVSLSLAPSSYVAGQRVTFKATNANTGASTLNLNGLGVKNIVNQSASALVANDILAGSTVSVVYDGTNFVITTIPKTFPDNTFRVTDNVDPTKQVAIEASGINTATTRTLTVQDTNGTIYVTGGQDVSVADGGTNISSYTIGDTIYASAAAVLSKLGIGTNGQVKGIVAGLPSWVNGPSWAYESTEQNIAANTTISLAHSLGYMPRDIQVVIRNKTTEYSWSVGDEIPMSSSGVQNNTGFGYGMNASTIYVTVPNAIWVYHRNSPVNFNAINPANWRIIVRAR